MGRITEELAENISDRMTELKVIMDITGEERDTEAAENLLYRTGRMYQQLSDIYDELKMMGGDTYDR